MSDIKDEKTKTIDNSITMTKEVQQNMSPTQAVDLLKLGNKRFLDKKTYSRDLNAQVADTAPDQFPFAAVLSCIDSRVPVELVFDQGIGDLFSARVAGNFVNGDILGSVEYACKAAGSKAVVVLGHTSCGAIKGACDGADFGNLTALVNKFMPAVDGTTTEAGEDRSSKNLSFVNRVSRLNVDKSIAAMKKDSPLLAQMEADGEITIVGAMYDVKTGAVEFFD